MTVPMKLSGRRQQAARNDTVILDAAREVFLADPTAPISAVADRAGVGISALYRRYTGKEDLLRRICHDGLLRFISEAEAAAADDDGWQAFTAFMQRVVIADLHSLTVQLAGTFTPTTEMHDDADRSDRLVDAIVERASNTGRLRPGIVSQDVGLILEACAAIRFPDPERTTELRIRYLTLVLDGLAAVDAPPVPGPAPAPAELGARWRP